MSNPYILAASSEATAATNSLGWSWSHLAASVVEAVTSWVAKLNLSSKNCWVWAKAWGWDLIAFIFLNVQTSLDEPLSFD